MTGTDQHRHIGKFELHELIGEGAMGAVWKAYDSVIRRYVALKILSGAVGRTQDARARFLREARAAGGLQHRNIVTIYDLGEADGQLFIALELVDGRDLSHLIAAPATSSRIGPYVFFRFEVIVPAPRFTQRPITECPTKPSCALLAYPRKTHAASSPRTRQWGPIADVRIGPPSSWVFAPTHSGPSSRVPARTSTPLSSTIGP